MRLTTIFKHEQKPRFPWVRIIFGAYAALDGIVGLIQVVAHPRSSYYHRFIPYSIIYLFLGLALLSSAVFTIAERRRAG